MKFLLQQKLVFHCDKIEPEFNIEFYLENTFTEYVYIIIKITHKWISFNKLCDNKATIKSSS